MELVLKNIVKKFDEKSIFTDASFDFKQGNIYGLLGRNGAGKTTLFNCIAKNMNIDSGTITIQKDNDPQPINDYPNTEVGFVHTAAHLPGFMTGYEFVKYFLEVNKAEINPIQEPSYYLQQAGIEAQDQHRLTKDYSDGMKNKLQMVISLLVHPPVLLLDEPLTSFDPVAAHEMKELILAMKSTSIIIFSTHILQLAQDLCDEIVLLHNHVLKSISAADIHRPGFEDEIVAILSDKTTEEVTHE